MSLFFPSFPAPFYFFLLFPPSSFSSFFFFSSFKCIIFGRRFSGYNLAASRFTPPTAGRSPLFSTRLGRQLAICWLSAVVRIIPPNSTFNVCILFFLFVFLFWLCGLFLSFDLGLCLLPPPRCVYSPVDFCPGHGSFGVTQDRMNLGFFLAFFFFFLFFFIFFFFFSFCFFPRCPGLRSLFSYFVLPSHLICTLILTDWYF